ncbi:MAG: tryptophan synthase subunit alpha, partial [Spirochaetota bacterium]
TGAKIMAGFGVSDRAQVEALEPHVHAAVVGSAFVKTVTAAVTPSAAGEPVASPDELTAAVERQMRLLVGA